MEAAAALPPEDRAKAMGVSHESVEKTLAHIFFADAIWYSRMADPSFVAPKHDQLPGMDTVSKDWPALQAKWEAWADAADDAELARVVEFASRFVGTARFSATQIVMHVVNHATLHRGQVVGMLRQLGVKPPSTDIMFYHFELAQNKKAAEQG